LIALYIILGIIAAVTLLFCVKITAELIYDETARFTVRVLFWEFPVYPEGPKKKKKPKKEKKPKEEKEKPKKEKPAAKSDEPPKENIVRKFCRNQGFDGVVEFLSDILRALNGFLRDVFIRGFVIEKLIVRLVVAKGDAAKTAMAYGRTCAAVFPALGYICQTMRVRKYGADINADYLAEKSAASLNLTVSTRPIRITNAIVVLAVKGLWALLRAKRREKKNNAKQKSALKATHV